MRLRTAAVLAVVALAAGACGGDEPVVATLPPVTTTGTSATSAVPTTTVAAIVSCPAVPFIPTYLPSRVARRQPPADAVALDRFTAVPGTSLSLWVDESGAPVVAVVRGALPPEQWLEKPEVIQVRDGVDAALGRLPGDMWAVAWFESDVDDCELYTIYLYPPSSADEARAVAGSLEEVAPAGG